jgi:hypothetical protein
MNSMSRPKHDTIPSTPETGIIPSSMVGISDVRPCTRSSMPGWTDTNRITPDATALPEAYAKSASSRMRRRMGLREGL